MEIRNEDLHRLVEQLQEPHLRTAYDFLQFLVERADKKPLPWAEIDLKEPDDEPLSEEALGQLHGDGGYVSGEEAKREFGLQVDLP